MFKIIILFLFTIFYLLTTVPIAHAIVDPLAVPNNKFGIHIIQATPDESSPAASLVNTNGDWGYITVLIESKDRNHSKWQEFFNDLRRRHLIPLVRLATKPLNEHWERPYEGEEEAWADFLDRLNWPTKNRYVIIYNEPNHAKEWGNKVDANLYAKVLDQFVTTLKNKNRDFFVLNGGFDASAPSKPPEFEDQIVFMKQMNEAVPGIFEKLDGWVSHSYPNPGFTGSPEGVGRGTVRTWYWEMQQLRDLGVTKNLPVFITETGWVHAEGLSYDSRLPSADAVASFYQQAFSSAWNNSRIVAITPFLLNYQETPFDHFSFKKPTGEKQGQKILGIQYPEYYSMYSTIQDLPKVTGRPAQEKKFKLSKGEIYSSIVAGENYTISLTFKNTGQSIWNDRKQIYLKPLTGGQELGIATVKLPENIKIEPEQEYTFNIAVKAPLSATYRVSLSLYEGEEKFDSDPVEFTTQVKSPVILKIIGSLAWKKDFSGNYLLKVKGVSGESLQNVSLNKEGESSGSLQPDLLSTILNPRQLWKLLPFSN